MCRSDRHTAASAISSGWPSSSPSDSARSRCGAASSYLPRIAAAAPRLTFVRQAVSLSPYRSARSRASRAGGTPSSSLEQVTRAIPRAHRIRPRTSPSPAGANCSARSMSCSAASVSPMTTCSQLRVSKAGTTSSAGASPTSASASSSSASAVSCWSAPPSSAAAASASTNRAGRSSDPVGGLFGTAEATPYQCPASASAKSASAARAASTAQVNVPAESPPRRYCSATSATAEAFLPVGSSAARCFASRRCSCRRSLVSSCSYATSASTGWRAVVPPASRTVSPASAASYSAMASPSVAASSASSLSGRASRAVAATTVRAGDEADCSRASSTWRRVVGMSAPPPPASSALR